MDLTFSIEDARVSAQDGELSDVALVIPSDVCAKLDITAGVPLPDAIIDAGGSRLVSDAICSRIPHEPQKIPFFNLLEQRIQVSVRGAKITRVHRIFHHALFREFSARRESLVRQYGRPVSRLAFHGLHSFEAMLSITGLVAGASAGFDPSYAGDGAYGDGSYFAEHASYPSFIHPALAYKRIEAGKSVVEWPLLVAEVLVGKTMDFGERNWQEHARRPPENFDSVCGLERFEHNTIGYRAWPFTPPSPEAWSLPQGFDWSTKFAGRQYVVFEKQCAYPHFIVWCRLERPVWQLRAEPEACLGPDDTFLRLSMKTAGGERWLGQPSAWTSDHPRLMSVENQADACPFVIFEWGAGRWFISGWYDKEKRPGLSVCISPTGVVSVSPNRGGWEMLVLKPKENGTLPSAATAAELRKCGSVAIMRAESPALFLTTAPDGTVHATEHEVFWTLH
jgi:hypothetical protein